MNGFGAATTAAEVVAGLDLSGTTAIVTGAASSIGLETARALASVGADVTLAIRDVEAGERVAAGLAAERGTVEVRELDLSNLASVDAFVAFVARWSHRPLDVLINNAGVMNTPEQYTPDEWELQFATNHLGHFALAVGLHPSLAADGGGRVVVVSSSGHGASPVVFDDLFFAQRDYRPDLAYGQSKTATTLFAVEASRRWAEDGITVNALMPGGIWTDLQRHWDPDELEQAKAASRGSGITKTPEQGAATSVLLATSPDLEGVGGRYYEDCHEADVVDEITDGLHGVRDYALDADAAHRLWDVSTALLAAARRAAGSESLAVVERFIHAIEDGRSSDIRALLAPDAVFHNGTIGILDGPDAIIGTLEAARVGMDGVEWCCDRTAVHGTTVFTERRDRFGSRGDWVEIPVDGVFETIDGRVTSWRDYFDAHEGADALQGLREPRAPA